MATAAGNFHFYMMGFLVGFCLAIMISPMIAYSLCLECTLSRKLQAMASPPLHQNQQITSLSSAAYIMKDDTSPVPIPHEASNYEELSMKETLQFSERLMELKSIKEQLYSAAEHFESSYLKHEQKQTLMTSLKGYALKAFVNTVDHLGSMSYKVNRLLDEKSDELSTIELPFSCFEQRFRTCQQYINSEGLLPQQSLFIRTPSRHACYIIHGKEFPPSRSCIREHPHAAYVPGPRATEETFMFAKASPNKGSDKRGTSPYRFHLACSPSPVSRVTSPNCSSSNTKRRYPTEPRRSASPRAGAGRDRSDNDLLMYASKNKRMFKALLSMRKPKSGVSLYKFLDDN